MQVPEGGWFALAVAFGVSGVMLVWWGGGRRLAEQLQGSTRGASVRRVGGDGGEWLGGDGAVAAVCGGEGTGEKEEAEAVKTAGAVAAAEPGKGAVSRLGGWAGELRRWSVGRLSRLTFGRGSGSGGGSGNLAADGQSKSGGGGGGGGGCGGGEEKDGSGAATGGNAGSCKEVQLLSTASGNPNDRSGGAFTGHVTPEPVAAAAAPEAGARRPLPPRPASPHLPHSPRHGGTPLHPKRLSAASTPAALPSSELRRQLQPLPQATSAACAAAASCLPPGALVLVLPPSAAQAVADPHCSAALPKELLATSCGYTSTTPPADPAPDAPGAEGATHTTMAVTIPPGPHPAATGSATRAAPAPRQPPPGPLLVPLSRLPGVGIYYTTDTSTDRAASVAAHTPQLPAVLLHFLRNVQVGGRACERLPKVWGTVRLLGLQQAPVGSQAGKNKALSNALFREHCMSSSDAYTVTLCSLDSVPYHPAPCISCLR